MQMRALQHFPVDMESTGDLDLEKMEAKRKEIIYTSVKGLINEPRVQDLYRRRVEKLNADLARYEQVKQFRILDHELTLEAGALTPSLKVRRRQVLEMYSDLIDSIYPESH